MFTHRYKSGYIHGYCDKPECTAQMDDGAPFGNGRVLGRFTSYRAAQRAITRRIALQRDAKD